MFRFMWEGDDGGDAASADAAAGGAAPAGGAGPEDDVPAGGAAPAAPAEAPAAPIAPAALACAASRRMQILKVRLGRARGMLGRVRTQSQAFAAVVSPGMREATARVLAPATSAEKSKSTPSQRLLLDGQELSWILPAAKADHPYERLQERALYSHVRAQADGIARMIQGNEGGVEPASVWTTSALDDASMWIGNQRAIRDNEAIRWAKLRVLFQ